MNPNTLRLVIVLVLAPTPILFAWWMRARRREKERLGLIDTTIKAKPKDINEFSPRVLLARFVGGFGSLFLAAGLWAVINNPAEWKTAAKAVAISVPMLAFAALLLKNESTTPLAVQWNRAAFLVYAIFFLAMLCYSPQKNWKPAYLTMLRLLATALFLAAVAGIACSFSRARFARWVLVVVQAGIANFWLFVILRSKGPALWGHPIAVGIWAAITFLLVISLFGKQSNAYYGSQLPLQTNQSELNQNPA